jgi:hypothetical protein
MTMAQNRPGTEPEQEYVERNDDEWRDPASPNTFPSGETVEADRRDADRHGSADRPPTAAEAKAAEGLEVDAHVADSYRAAMERGANVKGEGEIEPS